MSLAALLTPPPGITDADRLLDGLDACLVAGFARLGPDERATLDTLAASFAPSPLGPSVTAAVEGLARSEFIPAHLEAIAAARAALSGAVHDALLSHAAAVLGRSVAPSVVARPVRRPDGGPTEGARHALLELSLAGWGRLDGALVANLAGAPARLVEVGEPRLAALLAGLADELPGLDPAEAPLRRLGDLWCRAVVLAAWAAPAPDASFSGVLHPIGAELRAHNTAVSLVVVARGPEGAVRLHRSAWKVDVLSGVDLFRIAAEPELRAALAAGQALRVEGARQLGPDLTGGTVVAAGPAASPLDALLPGAADVLHAPPPLDRHPLTLSIPVTLTGKLEGDTWVSDGITLPIRWGPATTSPLVPEGLTGDRLLGLLRCDGITHTESESTVRWYLVPLMGTDKKKGLVSSMAWADGNPKVKAKVDVIAVLRERSSRLLRKK